MQRAVNLIKKISPPIIVDLFKTYLWRYGWHGNYKSWQDARKASTGYDSDVILRKVKTTLLEVKNNIDLSERNSGKFSKVTPPWPLLSALMWIAAQNDGKLNVIDFGGSLGSTYFHNKVFFDSLKDVKWNIVEQDNFVKCGKSYFETDIVKFYSDLGVCAEKTNAKIIIFSSVLQYLEKPYELLNIAINNNFEYVLIDRTPFIKKHEDVLKVQKAPPSIFNASFPCWFFSEDKFKKFMGERYILIREFDALDKGTIKMDFKGFIFIKKQ